MPWGRHCAGDLPERLGRKAPIHYRLPHQQAHRIRGKWGSETALPRRSACEQDRERETPLRTLMAFHMDEIGIPEKWPTPKLPETRCGKVPAHSGRMLGWSIEPRLPTPCSPEIELHYLLPDCFALPTSPSEAPPRFSSLGIEKSAEPREPFSLRVIKLRTFTTERFSRSARRLFHLHPESAVDGLTSTSCPPRP